MIRCGDRTFELGRRTHVMGIVNITPDSFSDGGQWFRTDDAVRHAHDLLAAGADLLDLGAESTRPGAVPIDEDEETRRLLPVVERLVADGVRCLSIDTYKPAVARRALEAGAAWINDVSGLADPAMIEVARQADGLVVMHHRPMSAGRPDDDVAYGDVVAEVAGALAGLVRRAVEGGVTQDRLVADPGIGFGKTIAGNVTLLARAGETRPPGTALLVGPSRKRFLTALSGAASLEERDAASVAACCAAAERGVDFVRMHRVEGLRAALAVADAFRS